MEYKTKATAVKRWCSGFVLGMLFFPQAGSAAENLIDHKLSKDTGGIYRAQHAVPITLGAISLVGAVWQGSEDRLGRTFWRSSEALVIGGVLTEGLKRVTRRQRPLESDDPNQWFKGSGNDSFPSGHVAATTALVTPILLEYRHDHPWVMALAALPVYEMVARVKAQKHWQTDVLAGAALGAVVGMYEQGRGKPLVVSLLPGGVFVGFRTSLP